MKLRVEYSSGNYWYIWLKIDGCTHWLLPDGTITTAYTNATINNWKTEQEAQLFLDSWMPRNKQLTISEVSEAATFSEKLALDYSIEHWKQNVLDVENANLGSSYCAVCEKAAGNGIRISGISRGINCILNNYSGCSANCCKEYEDFVNNRTEENAIAMLNKLVLIRNKKYGNPYREDKKMSSIINISGRYFSEETVEEALRKHCDFKSDIIPKVGWKHGDIALSYWISSKPLKRLILIEDGKIKVYSEKGRRIYSGRNQEYIKEQMESNKYEKIGNLFDDFTS